jgi:CO/xanthine dehydrogenase FAD-binding subunit
MSLEIIRVDSAKKAAALLANDAGARFIGGGTLAVRAVNYGDGSIRKLVLPDGLGLDEISVEGDRVTLGAAVTMAKVAADARLAFLKAVAESIGGPAVRAMATVGGNLFAPYPYGDFAVALLALGAEVTIETPSGRQTIDLEEFLTKRGNVPGGVVVSLSFRHPPAGAFRFAKVARRKPHGASVLSIAAMLPLANRKVGQSRVAYGAMAPAPIRARAVEKALEGKILDKTAIEAAVKAATDGCAPLTDPQASDWYRLSVLPVHLRRLLSGEEK